VFGLFSGALLLSAVLGPSVGRAIDNRGGRGVLPCLDACARPRARGGRKSKAVAGGQGRTVVDRSADSAAFRGA
jgi:hypothetical protein